VTTAKDVSLKDYLKYVMAPCSLSHGHVYCKCMFLHLGKVVQAFQPLLITG